eukprot:TRINITY_DN11456_c0_g1_i1.p1 TRINITY_DN11456_c0_g1~~TRINITY_DN11456_c0_g1_i1.p1  ORF type:complete len:333 (+),score=70.60 TRINITY_DN11456_c0_g1_i1:124-1122(+)
MKEKITIFILLVLIIQIYGRLNNDNIYEDINSFTSSSNHTNNWAVLVSTSRFWFNYRHVANTLSIYRTCKRLGIPDSNIILMLADDYPCNARNPYPGVIFNNQNHKLNVFGTNVEVDYRGYDVTVQNFIRILTGRHDDVVPRSKRLLSDDRSNILIYMTGHGGEGFLKFQDYDEISTEDIADAFEQMHQQKRYNEILFIVDTCQANGMYKSFYSPNIVALGSSSIGESSYSHHSDPDIGQSIIDRYTYYMLDFFEKVSSNTNKTILDLHNSFKPHKLKAHPGYRDDLHSKDISEIRATEFFGSVIKTKILENSYPLKKNNIIRRENLIENVL